MLNDLQTHWDNATLDYDLGKYNFKQWAIDVIQEEFPQVKELEKIHQIYYGVTVPLYQKICHKDKQIV